MAKKIIGFLCSIIFCTAIAAGMPQMAKAAETETFTGASGTSGDLDWNITAEGHLTVEGEGDYQPIKITYNTTYYLIDGVSTNSISGPEWLQYYRHIKTAELNITNITSTRYMFCCCINLTNINIVSFDTSKVTSMRSMFSNCGNLTSLDVSNFDTSNVIDMSWMFYSCRVLTSLDVNNFDTSNVTDTRDMFSCCVGLTRLDVNNFNTSKITNMGYMFYQCRSLTSLDISNFDTSNVTDMSWMFYNCRNLTNLDVSNFNTSKITNMVYMFSNCMGLTSLNLSNFDTSNVTNMGFMFSDCSGLISLDVSNFNTSNVKSMWAMFSNCNSLTSLDVSNFDTSNVTDMSWMFYNCRNLTSLDVSNFDISKASTPNTFDELRALEKLYLFANARYEYALPSLSGYRWIDENNETCTKTAKGLDRKMVYTRVDKDYVPTIISTPEPSVSPSTSPTQTPVPSLSPSPVVPSNAHIFSDYNYTSPVGYNSPVTGSAIIYGNGMNKKVDGKRVNNKALTLYTDILASYKHTPNSNGTVKSSVGKVIVAVTKTADKPTVSSRNKVTDTSASKIAKARIKNGQITVTAVGKESGIVYLWVIDTGNKGVSACCPIDVKLAPKKLEVQSITGTKLTKTKLENGKTLDVCVAGLVGSTKTDDCTYTATVDSKYQSYITVTPVDDSTNKFTIKAIGLKNNKDTKAVVTFKCDQNGKKTNLSLTITK